MFFLLFIFISITLQAILFVCHFFVWKTLVKFLEIKNEKILRYLKIIFFFLSITFISTSFISSVSSNIFAIILYNFTFYWLSFFYFFIFASLICHLLLFFGKKFDYSLNKKIITIFFFSLAVVLAVYGIVNARDIKVTSINLKIENIPAEWKGKKAIFLSDIHLGQIRSTSFANQIVDKIQAEKPDIVFFGGDLYDGAKADLEKVSDPLKRLSPPLGSFYILGNHEEFDGDEKYVKAAEKVNLRVLNNEKVDISGVQIVGVDYRQTSERANFQKVLGDLKIDPAKPSILLKHSPYYVEEAEKAGVSLQLSGHTHDGQMVPMNFIAKWLFYGFEAGLKKMGKTLIYTSSGAGTWGPPVRFGTNPEIVLINFK